MIAKCNILYAVLQNYKFPYHKPLTSVEPRGTLPERVKNFTVSIHQFPINVFLISSLSNWINKTKGLFAS